MSRKLRYYLFPVLFAVFAFCGCAKKKYDDSLPKVQLSSVTAYGADSVLLHGMVTYTGAADVEYTGFTFTQKPSSSVLDGQILMQGSNGVFYSIVAGYPDSTYYVKAFAANRFGYTQSASTTVTLPSAPPATAPCTLTNNQIKDNGLTFPVSASGDAVNPQYGGFTVSVHGSTEDIYISFPTAPYNGIYTTTTDGSNLTGRQAIVTITRFNQYVVNSGGKIYVAVSSSGVITISTCGLSYNIGSSTTSLWGKVSF